MEASTVTQDDERYLRRAIELAGAAAAAGDRPFGSLLVLDGEVLAEDRNTVHTERDIAAHPELKLARWAFRELEAEQVARTTMYTSGQPCPMCSEAIRRAGLGRVVFALSAEQVGELLEDRFGPGAQLAGPALYDEARAPFERLGS